MRTFKYSGLSYSLKTKYLQTPPENRNSEQSMSVSQQICVKKRRNETNIARITQDHKSNLCRKLQDLTIPVVLQDTEDSFIKWFNYIRQTLPTTHFKGMVNLNYIDENDKRYTRKLGPLNQQCQTACELNDSLNQVLAESIDNHLIKKLDLKHTNLCYMNFEIIKHYFQCKIDVFYLIDLELYLTFDNKVQFLRDLDFLTSVYQLIFNTSPDTELKLNWILNALNKDREKNKKLLMQIQTNWSKGIQDIIWVRGLIMAH